MPELSEVREQFARSCASAPELSAVRERFARSCAASLAAWDEVQTWQRRAVCAIAPALAAALDAASDAVDDLLDTEGPTPVPKCGQFVYYSGRNGRVPSPCYLDAGHLGECAAP